VLNIAFKIALLWRSPLSSELAFSASFLQRPLLLDPPFPELTFYREHGWITGQIQPLTLDISWKNNENYYYLNNIESLI